MGLIPFQNHTEQLISPSFKNLITMVDETKAAANAKIMAIMAS
jgi:hypothetical protein